VFVSFGDVNTTTQMSCFLVFLQRWGVSHLSTLDMFPVANTSRVPNVTSRRTNVLFGTSLSRYALLNASRTTPNLFDTK
jgi:hypothetical protein